MFGSIGITEIIILAAIALVVMGPEKFPDFARTVARMVRDVRSYVADAQRDLERETRPVRKELDELSKIDPETYIDRLAESAFEGEDEDSAHEYHPEPEGPAVEGAYPYGAYGADTVSESQAGGGEAPAKRAEDVETESPEPAKEKPSDQYAD